MIEDWRKQDENVDTASSDFYTAPPVTKPVKQVLNPRRQGIDEQSLPQVKIDQSKNLEQKIARIKEYLNLNTMRMNRIKSKQELQNYALETNQQLDIIWSKNQSERQSVKEQFMKQISQLQRQIVASKKFRKEFKDKKERLLNETIQQLKLATKQSENFLSNHFKDASIKMKCKFATFGRQLKDLKKNRSQKTSGALKQIEIIRWGLQEKIESESRKRCEYQQIVLNLLDKTCEQGELLLRRIC